MNNDILEAVLKAMILMDKVSGSQKNFLEILQYGKDLYYKRHEGPHAVDNWPTTWQAAMKLLLQTGYKSPVEYFVCLNYSHPCSFDMFKSKRSCRFSNANATDCIKYMYLPLKDKIARWCGNAEFCHKITAHWEEREHWLNVEQHATGLGYLPKNEIWDGNRFAKSVLGSFITMGCTH